MAPSPELGQPKAPDKTDTTAMVSTTGGKSEDKTDSGDKHESIKETDFSSTNTTIITNMTTTTTTTKQQDSENLSNLDERALEALLKEAITYKTPRDREHKSEMFRELLQDAEKENQKSDFSSYDLRYRKHKGSSRHTQGGSLQDLAETDNLDDIFGHNKKHYNLKQRHSSVSSRQREGGSLPSNVNVSFHNLMSFDTSCMFDVNLKKKCKNSGLHSMKQQQQQQQLNSKDESQMYDSKIVGDTVIEIGDDESDDNQTNIPYEPLQEELSDPINSDSDYTDVNSSLCQKLPRIQPQRQYTSQAKIEISESSPPRLINQSNADKTVSFSLLENSNNKNNVDITPVQLNPSYNSVESIVGNKSTEINSRPIASNKFVSTNIFPQKLDVGDNSVQPFNASLPTSSQPNKIKNKKVPKSDRNTITVDYSKKEGFRGTDTINDLVRYIEAENETEKRRKENSSNNNGNNSNYSNSNNPSNNNHNNNGAVLNSNSSNKRSKNNNNNSKKDSSSKLKKCNSLEELSSCSKLKELKESSNTSNNTSSSLSSSSSASSTTSQNQIPAEAVTLRTKSNTTKTKQNSDPNSNIIITNSSTTTNNNNNTNKKLVLIKKRSERRSWGTEELSYLGDNKVNSDYIKNNELLKSNSDDVNNNDDESLINNSGSNNINSLESNELISSQVSSMDASEFLLVTKKKKPKKIKLENNNSNVNNNNNKNSGNNNRGTNNRSKYNHNNNHMTHNSIANQNNHHLHHNDRDIYLNSFNSADNNRRKSTSSVPPSERSDSSDLDSVHSLPVESIKTIKISSSNLLSPPATTKQSSNQISYADIAKIPNKQNTNVNANNIDMLNNNTDTTITTPTTNATTTENLLNKQLLYSKSLNEIKTSPNQLMPQPQQPNGIIMSQIPNKNQFLLKSKSVDNDNYNVSIDQYPALEKTVKKSSNTNSIYVSNPIIDNRMIKASKKLPSPQNFVTTTISTPKKILIEPLEVSQIEKSIVDELYNKPVVLNNKPAALKQVVVNNNNNANINKLNEFRVAPVVEIRSVVVTPGPVIPVASISSSTSTATSTSKRPKKDKSNPTSVILKNNINNSNSNRPAVIILNDMDRDKPGNDITFGFEINQNLLFGDFNEDEMKLFETTAPQTTVTTTTTNNSDVSDYFSISDTSLELSGTTMTNTTPASLSNPSNNNIHNKLQDTDNQCDIINNVEQDIDKLNNNNMINNLVINNNNSLDKNENFKICEIDITKINFKAPNLNDIILTEHNHDKIVNFIESAWEDIISGTNGGAQYYNGQ